MTDEYAQKIRLRQAEAVTAWGLESAFPLQQAAADFYLLYHAHLDDSSLRCIVERQAAYMAGQFKLYLDAASGGELRHGRVGTNLMTTCPQISAYISYAGTDRWVAWVKWKSFRDTHELPALEWAKLAFTFRKTFTGGFGGRKWAVVVDAVHRYLTGEYNDVIFVDTALGIEHNYGPVFNKLWETINMKQIYYAAFNGELWRIRKFASEGVLDLVKV